MQDSTVFSIDVAATKARNMVYFNSAIRTVADLTGVPMGTAATNRTIGFGAQPLYPPGIDGSNAGPFFNLYATDLANPARRDFKPVRSTRTRAESFSFRERGLFRNGSLVGGLGVSGDGVDQDDFVTNAGRRIRSSREYSRGSNHGSGRAASLFQFPRIRPTDLPSPSSLSFLLARDFPESLRVCLDRSGTV